ncbi:long-chain fatty acid--CoA ligase, partial [Mobiluncus curtisii]|nr:long-chain fatty acid--CoA ligase [Mobiluncus curtisii]
GVPDPTWGEIVAAVVVQTPDTPENAEPLSLEQLQDFARPYLTKAELPRALRLVSRIPLNSNGKPDRQGLLTLFQ